MVNLRSGRSYGGSRPGGWGFGRMFGASAAGYAAYRTDQIARDAARAAVNYMYGTPSNNRQAAVSGRPMQLARGGPKSIQTPGGSLMRVKRFGGVAGRSGGFVKTKRIKRKKAKKVKKSTHINKGVEKTVEAYKTAGTTSQCLHIGHSNFAKQQILDLSWKAVIKLLFQKQSVYINEWTDVSAPYNAADYRITVQYNKDNVISAETLTMTAATTYEGITNWLSSIARAYYDRDADVDLQYISIFSNVTPEYRPFCRLNIHNCKIAYECKSNMKVQNRTINSGTIENGEADDVDNVPLYGKLYGGKGIGLTRPRIDATQQVYANNQTGYIESTEFGGAAGRYKEPIDALYYDKVKQEGKVRIEPGAIKTSSLSSRGIIYLNTVVNLNAENVVDPKSYHGYGKYRIMSLEKIIDTIASDTAPGISVGIEVNNRYRVTAISWNNMRSNPEFVRMTAV